MQGCAAGQMSFSRAPIHGDRANQQDFCEQCCSQSKWLVQSSLKVDMGSQSRHMCMHCGMPGALLG